MSALNGFTRHSLSRQLPGGAVPLLQREEDKQEAFEAIRSLIDQIILSPEESKLRVDLHGEIAAILTLAQAGKNPARGLADRAEQLVMVAGTGFEPVTFRL